ncbi:MAG: LysM peptidoglycan-binding domain-containing protein [Deltaproteobacteria bacterium]|nr:LysM peptidoglycan-binding domain-containing protein [Deltaproteobacteria bacterium]
MSVSPRSGVAAPLRRAGAPLLALGALVTALGAAPARAQSAAPTEPAAVLAEPGAAPASSAPPAAEGAPAADAAPAEQSPPGRPDVPAAEPARAGKARPGGVNPCMTPDPGWGIYDRWSRAPSMGQMIAPGQGGLTRDGGFDLLVHFHGHEPIRKEFVQAADGIVLVGIDLGIGSAAYSAAFASPEAFPRLLASVEQEMARRSGRERTHVRKLALSAWSAGYGAIEQILTQSAGKKVDAVILLDSVYGSYQDAAARTLVPGPLAPFVELARQAARGERFVFHSFSSIQPPGYASTSEVAHYILKQLGATARKVKRSGRYGLEMFERYDAGGYHVRGYRGEDKPDHCAHLGLMRDVIKIHLGPRWRPPRGRKAPAPAPAAPAAGSPQGRPGPSAAVHVVADGQSLTSIARRYGVSVAALCERNRLDPRAPLQLGRELLIPQPKPGRQGAHRTGAALPAPRPGEQIHVVGEGQSLTRIARRYHVTVDALRERNGVGEPIQPGQKLVIPARNKPGRPGKPGKKAKPKK